MAFLARLDTGAFDAIGGEVVNVALYCATAATPAPSHSFAGIDASTGNVAAKASTLRSGNVKVLGQAAQVKSPDSRILLDAQSGISLLSLRADSRYGLRTGRPRAAGAVLVESSIPEKWRFFQGTVDATCPYGGRGTRLPFWEDDRGALRELARPASRASRAPRGLLGPFSYRSQSYGWSPGNTYYTGDVFDNGTAVVWSREDANISRRCLHSVGVREFAAEVGKIDRSIKVTNQTLLKVPFDAARWHGEAAKLFPQGLPAPHSSDCRQWLFDGDPRHGTDVLQVAVGRLLGARWPRQTGAVVRGCPPAPADGLADHEDDDGIVCLAPLKGEQSAADRLSALLGTVYAKEWRAAKLDSLLDVVGHRGGTLDDWLRDSFFAQHCDLFETAPVRLARLRIVLRRTGSAHC